MIAFFPPISAITFFTKFWPPGVRLACSLMSSATFSDPVNAISATSGC